MEKLKQFVKFLLQSKLFWLIIVAFISLLLFYNLYPPDIIENKNSAGVAKEDIKYKIFCANQKTEIGARSLKELQKFRDKNACERKEEETSLANIMTLVQTKYEGVGARCKCEN